MADWRTIDGHAGRPVEIKINGQTRRAPEGQNLAAALLSLGCLGLSRNERSDNPRGVFCGMGVCFSCLVTVDGRANQQACRLTVRPGMEVEVDGD